MTMTFQGYLTWTKYCSQYSLSSSAWSFYTGHSRSKLESSSMNDHLTPSKVPSSQYWRFARCELLEPPQYPNNSCNTLQIHDQKSVFLQWFVLNYCTQVYCCTGLVLVLWRCFPWVSKLLVAISAGMIFTRADKCRRVWLVNSPFVFFS